VNYVKDSDIRIGALISHYQVTGKLGAGGMGEVYRARDSKLNREVAIKVLPEGFAQDAERVARFQREALVLASLNHPNIAAIYGVEESDEVRALVMELVDGPTLADRIAAGPIPIEEALMIAGQIAEALEVAHERGVIHRDLKPANVKVTSDDKVKVLDFGLAKIAANEAPSDDLSHSPTMIQGTQAGMILGTAAYMSPEQAKGKAVDKRADVWTFGCVLYVAYVSDESGHDEVYIKPFPNGEGKWQFSVSGGAVPRWSRRGNELFFVAGNDLMAVPVRTKPSLVLGQAQKLFARQPVQVDRPYRLYDCYDVSADGQHFVMLQSAEQRTISQTLTVVQNWFAEFKDKQK
jgi:serine/threonine protein kinase